ncbi:MAG: hypothetical protein EOO20_13670 [Chryseobacterium sp.]|nr:MAG: hypothetical protein EOO20_13670 [Chryseobacterium sp.]
MPKVYETAFRERNSEGNKGINLDSDIGQWTMDENQIEDINKRLADGTYQKWTKKDFAFSNIIIRNTIIFHDKGFFESHIGKSQLVYTLSDLVF